MTDNMTPEKKGIPTFVKGAIAAGVLAAGIGGAAIGLNRGEQRPDVTPTPSAAAASPTPEVKPTANPTATATRPPEATPTKTPEVKQGGCFILEDALCSQGELISYKSSQGETLYIAWRDLPQNSPIRSLIDGQRTTAQINQPSPTQGQLLSVYPPDRSANYNFIGDIVIPTDASIQTGKVIATVGNAGMKSFGEYELLFTITKTDPSTRRPVVDVEHLKRLFPNAFEKQPKDVTFTGPGSTTVSAPDYQNKP
jgi:hypothetical protein